MTWVDFREERHDDEIDGGWMELNMLFILNNGRLYKICYSNNNKIDKDNPVKIKLKYIYIMKSNF